MPFTCGKRHIKNSDSMNTLLKISCLINLMMMTGEIFGRTIENIFHESLQFIGTGITRNCIGRKLPAFSHIWSSSEENQEERANKTIFKGKTEEEKVIKLNIL